MSHAATNWAIKQRGIRPAAKIVLWHLCDRYHPDHGCFPSLDTLAEDCEMSRRSVQDQIEQLVDAGLVIVEKKARERGRLPLNSYRFPFETDLGQNLPWANSALGKSTCSPLANSRNDLGQNLPTNPVRGTSKRTSKDDDAPSAPSFSAFWEAWPVKKAKVQAEKNWKKLAADDKREAVRAARSGWFDQWRRQNPKANPIHPGTFLSEKRWQDEDSSAPNTPTASGGDWLDKMQRSYGATN